MLLRLLYSLVRFLLEILLVRTSSEARLRAEVLALRHQLRVLECQVKRPHWQPSDRLPLDCPEPGPIPPDLAIPAAQPRDPPSLAS